MTPMRILEKPVLSFSDTGISVSDGVTRNGLWSVSTLDGWEYSLDMGATWTLGEGDFFEVKGDGPKTIWVRAADGMGNTSEIVVARCVLDTMPPVPPQLNVENDGATRVVQVTGVETQGTWEYSVDPQGSWLRGTGERLAVVGNALATLWLRQLDLAGNASPAREISIFNPGPATRHDASSFPREPRMLHFQGAKTVLLHGSVRAGDSDYIRWDVPPGHRLLSMRVVRYVSAGAKTDFALHRSAIFDAGRDARLMLAHGRIEPYGLIVNLLREVPSDHLGPGALTLSVQQTAPNTAEYAIELVFDAIQ
jgi:hypothetical protein